MAAAPNGNGSGSGSGVGTVWAAFSKLDIVQEVLDRNRSLLEEIRGNHNSGGPDDLARNCVLIKELNGNISEVIRMYQEISESYVRYMGLSPEELTAEGAKPPTGNGDGNGTGTGTGTGAEGALPAGGGEQPQVQQEQQRREPGSGSGEGTAADALMRDAQRAAPS